jgi:hypothetical protein|tara:strand:- start:3613 stop:3858 length:246 start_codon:yes stop_codon:yes gene_type:complete
MNGRKSKLIRNRAVQLQIEWLKDLAGEEDITLKNIHKFLPQDKYVLGVNKCLLSFMNHKWIEKKLKKNINLNLEKLIQSNA